MELGTDTEPEPRCDICGRRDYDSPAGFADADWNPETGNHASCEAAVYRKQEVLEQLDALGIGFGGRDRATEDLMGRLVLSEWEMAGDAENEDDVLVAYGELLPGYPMHVMAVAVVVDDQGVQQPKAGGTSAFADLCELAVPDGPFRTMKIDGRDDDYVIWAEPFCE